MTTLRYHPTSFRSAFSNATRARQSCVIHLFVVRTNLNTLKGLPTCVYSKHNSTDSQFLHDYPVGSAGSEQVSTWRGVAVSTCTYLQLPYLPWWIFTPHICRISTASPDIHPSPPLTKVNTCNQYNYCLVSDVELKLPTQVAVSVCPSESATTSTFTLTVQSFVFASIIMAKSIVNTHQYPFQFEDPIPSYGSAKSGQKAREVTVTLPNSRGRIPSIQAARLRGMMLEAHQNPNKILAHACSYDGLTSRLVEEAGFPMVFLAGYPCASSYG